MPEPKRGEPKNAYISRFMRSSEAQASFPKNKQRVAVAEALFRREQAKKK
jgi:hypothetical protein